MPALTAPERLASLDAFRCFVMLWIIGGEGLMVGLAALGHNRVIDTVVYEQATGLGRGCAFYDCIWPCFMLLVESRCPSRLQGAPLLRPIMLCSAKLTGIAGLIHRKAGGPC